jgi:hypothetical protein
VSVGSVNVAAIDVNDATTQIAQKIKGPIQDGLRKNHERLEAAALAQFTRRNL